MELEKNIAEQLLSAGGIPEAAEQERVDATTVPEDQNIEGRRLSIPITKHQFLVREVTQIGCQVESGTGGRISHSSQTPPPRRKVHESKTAYGK